MKGLKHIVFRLLFLITLFFCLGLEVYTNNSTPGYKIELSSELNYKDNNIISGVDSSEDDHINQTHAFPDFVKQLTVISISNDSHSSREFIVSSWKPPKYS